MKIEKKKIKIVNKKCNLCKAKVEKIEKKFLRFPTPENCTLRSLSVLVK